MSIEKKSLISTLNTTKKANVAKESPSASVNALKKSPSGKKPVSKAGNRSSLVTKAATKGQPVTKFSKS